MFDRFAWWHAALIFVAANALSALPAGLGGDGAFYDRLRKPPGSPPDWAFPVAWLFLNVTSLIALHLVANARGGGPRTLFLASEAAGWVLFASFTALYFGLRSLPLAAANTLLGLAAAVVSLTCAWRLREAAGPWPFWLILPRVGWLTLAGYVSVATAWLNRGAA